MVLELVRLAPTLIANVVIQRHCWDTGYCVKFRLSNQIRHLDLFALWENKILFFRYFENLTRT